METLIRIVTLKAGQARPYADTIDKYEITTTRSGYGNSGAWEITKDQAKELITLYRNEGHIWEEGEPMPHPFVPVAKFEKEGANRWTITITSKFTD